MNTGFSATYTSKKPNCFRVRSLRPLGYISMLYKRVPLLVWQHPAAKTTHIFYSTFAYSASSKMTEYKNTYNRVIIPGPCAAKLGRGLPYQASFP